VNLTSHFLKNNVGTKDYELAANLNREYNNLRYIGNSDYEKYENVRNLLGVFLMFGIGLFAYSQYRNYSLYRYTHMDFLMTKISRE